MTSAFASEKTAEPAAPKSFKVLFITSQWPTPEDPSKSPFVEREVRALREAGVEVDVLPYDGGWSPGRYLRVIREMRRRIKHNKYDLIHAYFGQCGLVARAQFKLPVVVTYGGSDVHGSPAFKGFNRYKHYVLIAIGRLMSLLVNQVIVVSANLGELLPRKDYHVITIALDLDLFKPMDKTEARKQLGLTQDHKLALFVAINPQNPRKRIDLALEACRIASETRKIELIAAGKRPPEEIPVYMSACDVLLMTSTHEGSPNVVREALACNLPVVSTDVGDVRQRIGHLPQCAVVASDDPKELAEELLRVLGEKATAPLRNEVLDQDYHLIGSKVVQVYELAVNRKGNRNAGDLYRKEEFR
jgi:teichuronic acid biosynthesis glycosyltransferase TuaC